MKTKTPLADYIESFFPPKSYREWAEEMDIAPSYFAQIARGDRMPGRKTIAKINNATDGALPASAWFTNNQSTSQKAPQESKAHQKTHNAQNLICSEGMTA